MKIKHLTIFLIVNALAIPISAMFRLSTIANLGLYTPSFAINMASTTQTSILPADEGRAQKSYAQQRLIVHEQAQSAQLKEIIYKFFGNNLAQKIANNQFALGASLEIDGITFKRQFHGHGDNNVLVSISIPYFESVEKQNPTDKESTKFAIAATLAHLIQIKDEMRNPKGQYKEINSFLEAANLLHLTSTMLCEKSYAGLGNEENFIRCRRIAQTRLLGLGEPLYRIECLVYLPLATLEAYNKI